MERRLQALESMPDPGITECCAGIIETMAFEALEGDATAVRRAYERVLEVVRRAMSARSVTLLSKDRTTGEVGWAVTVGDAGDEVLAELLRAGVASAGPTSGSGEVGEMTLRALVTSQDFTAVPSLLGVTLPPRGETDTTLVFALGAGTRDERERLATRWQRGSRWIVDCLTTLRGSARLAQAFTRLHMRQRARTHMVSLVAHDVRGPLSTAKLAAQLLSQDPGVSAECRKLGQRIDQSIDRSERLIRDLLDANRVHAGRALSVRRRRCDLRDAVLEVADRLRVAHGERLLVEAPVATFGDFDAEQLQRVISNLVSIAVKEGAMRARICIRLTQEAGRARLAIHPVPLGAEEDGAPSARAELGLALAQGGAGAHGGRIEIRTHASGTTIALLLPLAGPTLGARDERPHG